MQYAVLDDHSNVSFIVSKTLCERFNLQGPSTELLLTTMQQQNVRVKTKNISGLEILDYHRECVVKIPVAFTRELVSAKRSHIPKPEVAREWQHLKLSPISGHRTTQMQEFLSFLETTAQELSDPGK